MRARRLSASRNAWKRKRAFLLLSNVLSSVESKCMTSSRFLASPLLISLDRADEKTAKEYSIEAGSVLHLVLALRGGL